MSHASMKVFALKSAALGAAALSTTMLSPAMAQTPASSSGFSGVEEVTVFARRKAESIQTVPISLTAFTPDAIDRRGLTSLVELTTVVPNVVIDNQSGGPTTLRVFIRGNGSQDRSSSADPSVGLYLDGVYIGKNRGVNLDLFGLEGVEVLRGPQGTLFGRNTTAGALVVRTKQPSFDAPEYKADLRVGQFGRTDIRGYINAPITDNFAANLSLLRARSDGYFTNAVTGNDIGGDDTLGLRGNVSWQASDRITLTAGFDYTRIDTTPVGAIALADEINPNGIFGINSPIPPLAGLVQAFGGVVPGVTTGTREDPFTVRQDRDGLQDFTIWGVRGNALIDFDAHNLELIASYRENEEEEQLDFDGTSIPLLNSMLFEDYSQLSLEAKLTRDDAGPLQYTVGATYFENDSTASQSGNDPDDFNEFRGMSLAVYGEAEYDLTDALSVFAGARFVYDERDMDITTGIDGNGQLIQVENSDDFTGVTGRVGANYQLRDNILLYGVYARGYKSGSFNFFPTSGPDQVAIDPETVNSFEIGAKTDLFNDRLRFNIAGFYAIYKDLQVATADSPIAAVEVINAGRSTSIGVEMDTQLVITQELRVTGTVGLMDADFDDDEVAFGLLNREIPLSPDVTASITVNYEKEVVQDTIVTAGFTAAYRSEYANGVSDGQTPNQYIEPSRWLADLNVGARHKGFYVNFIVKNLFDKDYFAQALPIDSLGIAPATAGQPRTFEASIGFDF